MLTKNTGCVVGTFVVPWNLTKTDYVKGAAPDNLRVGGVWSRMGACVRVDGPPDVLLLDQADAQKRTFHRAAARIRSVVGLSSDHLYTDFDDGMEYGAKHDTFTITDGLNTYQGWLIHGPQHCDTYVMFKHGFPKRNVEYWVVRVSLSDPRSKRDSGLICFAEGTLIHTEAGPRPIEQLRSGDQLETRDNGLQSIAWLGSHHVSNAQLRRNPALRPVRIRQGALPSNRPSADLLLSPNHRLLVSSGEAERLFNTHETLILARDIAKHIPDKRAIYVDTAIPQVTYYHLLTGQHEIIWANGVEAETLHPSDMDMGLLDHQSRQALYTVCNEIEDYGSHARRCLSPSETEILHYRN